MIDARDIRANSAQGMKWHSFAHVDKYSADQTEFAVRKSGLLEPKSDVFQKLFKEGEDGEAEAYGNVLLDAGLTRITSLILANGGLQAFSSTTSAAVGVGSTSTAESHTDTTLGANGTTANGTVGARYQAVDSTPTLSLGQMTAVSTFSAAGTSAFAWQEWGWVIVTGGSITATTTMASLGTSVVMLNHKTASLGTKTSSASWVLTTTVTLQ